MIDLLRADLVDWVIKFALHLDGEIHSKWTFDDVNSLTHVLRKPNAFG